MAHVIGPVDHVGGNPRGPIIGSPEDRSGTAPFVTNRQRQETFLPPEKIQAFENLNETLDDPFGGTGIQSIIQQLLESLVPGEDIARRNQADQFRRSGAISDASRGVAGARLEGELGRNRSTTAAQGLLQFLAPLLQGRGTALTGIPALTKSSSESFGFAPPAQHIRNARGSGSTAPASGGGRGGGVNQIFNFGDDGGGGGGGGGGGSVGPGPAEFSPGASIFGPGAGLPPGISGSGSSVDPFRNFNKSSELGHFRTPSEPPVAPPDFDFLFGR